MLIHNFVSQLSKTFRFKPGSIIRSLSYVLMTYLVVLWLSAIILGMDNKINWALPLQLPSIANNLTTFLMVMFVFTYIVLLFDRGNRLAVAMVFIIGSSVLMLLLGVFEDINPGFIYGRVDLMPGPWLMIGLMIVILLATWLDGLIFKWIQERLNNAQTISSYIIQIVLSLTMGMLPVIVYGSWHGQQLRNI